MGVHCESEKKVGEPNWVEIVKYCVATCLWYSSLSVNEGRMNVLSPYSFGVPFGFWSRISSALGKYLLCAWAISFMFRLTKRPKTAQMNSYCKIIN
jgi:hypothetical protein